MSRTSAQPVAKRNDPSHLFARSKPKKPARALTSATIAADIAAFKKRGGRIEILGNTPFRPFTAFRSKGNTPRTAPAASGKAAAPT